MKQNLIRILLITVIVVSSSLGNNYAFAETNKSQSPYAVLKKAADGDANAQFEIGLKIEANDEYEQRYEEAFRWFNSAAKKDHAIAQFKIGVYYGNGFGVKEDKSKAYEWFLKSANQGYAPAQNIIGEFYTNGWAFAKDFKKADEWFLKSANQNFAIAQYNLGMLYYNGLTGIKNDILAYKWILLASLQKDKDALDMKKDLENELTNEQKEHGIELSRYFLQNLK